MKFENIIKMVGNTPVVRIRSDKIDDSVRLWIKLEGYNPSGSIKDRACISNIRFAEQAGKLKPGMILLDASSGNMACALAYYGCVLGYQVKVICSSKLTQDKANFIRYFGGELEKFGHFTIEGNKYCREVILPKEPKRYCFLDQLHNWANPEGSYTTLGPEIISDFPEISAVIGSLGSGGSLLGTARYLKERSSDIKVFAVQAASGTVIPGTGNFDDGDYITPFIKTGYEENSFDYTIKIKQEEAKRRVSELAQQGIFVGYQTGGVFQAALKAVKEHKVTGDIVLLSGDTGWKNMEKLLTL